MSIPRPSHYKSYASTTVFNSIQFFVAKIPNQSLAIFFVSSWFVRLPIPNMLQIGIPVRAMDL